MVERRFSEPQSLVGASADEVLAMKPEGWLVRPFPEGVGGFRMLSPGKMPGRDGIIEYHVGGSPNFVANMVGPTPAAHVLNGAAESQQLVDILNSGVDPDVPAEDRRAAVAELIPAASWLVAHGRIRVYEDDLISAELRLLDRKSAIHEVEQIRNWWVDETDSNDIAVTSVYVTQITAKGVRELLRTRRRAPRPRRRR
jgi:hypothetical protein